MRFPSWDQLKGAYWYSFRDEAIYKSPLFFPRTSDPTVISPSDSPDGKGHMFAHTWLGIVHYETTSGLNWERKELVFLRAHSPFIYKEGARYYMVYETHDPDWVRKSKDVTKKGSRVMLSTSEDLRKWTPGKVILEAKDIASSSYRNSPSRISRPQLVPWRGGYRLYFGAGEFRIYDTDQKTTACFMMAESDYIEGPYKVHQDPIIQIEPDSQYRNLAPGGIRVIALSDKLAAIECSYFFDKEENRSRSAMLLLESSDGIEWNLDSVMQLSPLEGWSNRAITGCDLSLVEDEDTWYCFYSANEKDKLWKIFPRVRESVGLLLGKIERRLPTV